MDENLKSFSQVSRTSHKSFILLILAFLLIASASYYFVIKPIYFALSPVSEAVESKFDITDKTLDEVLTLLPKDIFTEKDAQVLQSYVADSKDGKFKQITLVYLSGKSFEELNKLFSEYIKGNNWFLAGTQIGQNKSSFVAIKENAKLNISVQYAGGKCRVDITVEK